MAIFASILNLGGKYLGSTIGGPLGANIGGNIGTIVGGFIDKSIFGRKDKAKNEQLPQVRVTTAAQGIPIPRVFGTTRVQTNVIWIGGKTNSTGSYDGQTYRIVLLTFAVALCEGPIQGIRRMWCNGQVVDTSVLSMAVYYGTDDQTVDPTIALYEDDNPAYRGMAYIVFTDFDLSPYGNQIPNINVEVYRFRLEESISPEDLIEGVSLIPSSGEFIYEPETKINQETDSPVYENVHLWENTDIVAAIEDLERTLPNCTNILLVVSWFGSDLRCGENVLLPKVDQQEKNTSPDTWEVSGTFRQDAELVSSIDGNPAYGGTPSDKSIYNCIRWLTERGYSVTFYPFILMDIESGNTLPNPYTGTNGQPAYPWRGRITCDPAIGESGTPDKTAAAADQVEDFFGDALVVDFADWNGNTIVFNGPEEWTFRRFILHYAKLCEQAGGIAGFIIGSEMIGMTSIRSSSSVFPAITQFKTLAADVKSILGGVPISYAADWSEYHSYRPDDGTDDVYFNLDPLWSDSNIDFIAIDNYLPLSDWRDGTSHLDYGGGAGQATTIYDVDYLKENVEGGEYYDWFYASPTDRTNQTRTNIVDSAYGKHWVFKQKDIKSWWQNSHYNRPSGVESGSPTSWTPESKKIIFSEYGCPSIDKGTNQPNVFYDPKSSESFFPYFSHGWQDNLIQRQYLKATTEYWGDSGNNPISSVYSAPMLDIDNSFVWTWDARPFPAFPYLTSVWGDGDNWARGHWLTGKLGTLYLYQIVEFLCDQAGAECDVSEITDYRTVKGYIIDRLMSPREIIDSIIDMHNVTVVDSGGVLKFFPKFRESSSTSITNDDIVLNDNQELVEIVKSFDLDIPKSVNLSFVNFLNDFSVGSTQKEIQIATSQEVVSVNLPVTMTPADANNIATFMVNELAMKREAVNITLPISFLYLEAGDVIEFNYQNKDYLLQIVEVTISNVMQIMAVSYSTEVYELTDIFQFNEEMNTPDLDIISAIDMYFLDIPTLTLLEFSEPILPRAAVNHFMNKAAVSLYDNDDGIKTLNKTIVKKAKTGLLATDFYGKIPYIWQENEIWVFLKKGQSLSANLTERQVLDGGNTCLVFNGVTNGWFVFQYSSHEVADSATNKYRLYGNFIHGVYGTEKHNAEGEFIALDAPVIFLQGDTGLTTIPFINARRVIDNDYSYGPSTQPNDSVYYTNITKNFNFEFLKPYSPCHLKAIRESNNDIIFTWIRRSRSLHNEDDWINEGDNLLGEVTESYSGTIYDNSGVSPVLRRTFTASSEMFTYTEAQQIADGGVISDLLLLVGQISGIYGVGDLAEKEFSV